MKVPYENHKQRISLVLSASLWVEIALSQQEHLRNEKEKTLVNVVQT